MQEYARDASRTSFGHVDNAKNARLRKTLELTDHVVSNERVFNQQPRL